MKIVGKDIQKIEEPIAVTIGFFDGVHTGHRFLLNKVKDIAQHRGYASAVLTFKEHPRKVLHEDFQPALLCSYEERLQRLGDTGIDYCIPIDFTKEISQMSAEVFMKKILKERFNAEVLIIGYDHRFGFNRTEGFAEYINYGKGMGITVIQTHELDTGIYVSSSRIRKLLAQGEVENAAKLLGYNYVLTGKVVEGNKIGRTIGFPTANIELNDPQEVVPSQGIYAAYVYLNGQKHEGMLYIGSRPTVNSGSTISIEVNILDFDEQIYGKELTVEFLRYIRHDARFASLEILKRQLQMDEERIRKYFNSTK